MGDGALRLKLGTAAASRRYLGSMAGETPALLGFLCVCGSLRENIRGDSRDSRAKFLVSSFGEDVVEGALRCSVRICRVCRPIEGQIHIVGICIGGVCSRLIFHAKRGAVGVCLLSKFVEIVICKGSGTNIPIRHRKAAISDCAISTSDLPHSRDRFGDIVGVAFLGDGFYGVGGDGEETDDADNAKGENPKGDYDFYEAECFVFGLHL